MKPFCFFIWLLLSCISARAQNYGIGTTNPQSRLHVAGRLRADSFGTSTIPQAQLHTTGTVLHQALAVNNSTNNVYADDDGLLGSNPNPRLFSAQNTSPQNIPDNDCAGVNSSITMSGAAPWVKAKDISVTLTINHQYNGDLQAVLTAPNGRSLTLMNVNGGNGQNFINCTLSDYAVNMLPTGNQSGITGFYKPTGTSGLCFSTANSTFEDLAHFADGGMINPNGVWTLRIIDRNLGFTGSLVAWQLTNVGITGISNQYYIPKWFYGKLMGDEANIYDNGKVGIRNNSPQELLDVNGVSVNKNKSCVIYTADWTGSAADTGYAAGTFFVPSVLTDTGIVGNTRLITQVAGTIMFLPGAVYSTGLFIAPATGFYTVTFRVKDIQPGRLLIAASLSGAAPEEILDEYISGNCTPCDDRSYSMTLYMQQGDTHRLLRQVSSVLFGAMIIAYRLEG